MSTGGFGHHLVQYISEPALQRSGGGITREQATRLADSTVGGQVVDHFCKIVIARNEIIDSIARGVQVVIDGQFYAAAGDRAEG